MWGLNLQPGDQVLYALWTEPADTPGAIFTLNTFFCEPVLLSELSWLGLGDSKEDEIVYQASPKSHSWGLINFSSLQLMCFFFFFFLRLCSCRMLPAEGDSFLQFCYICHCTFTKELVGHSWDWIFQASRKIETLETIWACCKGNSFCSTKAGHQP